MFVVCYLFDFFLSALLRSRLYSTNPRYSVLRQTVSLPVISRNIKAYRGHMHRIDTPILDGNIDMVTDERISLVVGDGLMITTGGE